MPGERRAGAAEHAARVNTAAELLEAGMPAADAARVLAGRLGCSQRQARRYLGQAAARGLVPVPEPGVVFTVRLPGRVTGYRALPGLRPWHKPASFDILTHSVRQRVARHATGTAAPWSAARETILRWAMTVCLPGS